MARILQMASHGGWRKDYEHPRGARSHSGERDEILRGLTAPQKRLSPKYFYDERGSELFDRIC